MRLVLNDLHKLSKQQLIALVLQLAKQNEQLQDRLARLEKNSSNSSKPPSSDIVDPRLGNKKKRKRKVGGQRGHKKHTRQPFSQNEIDKTIELLPMRWALIGGGVLRWTHSLGKITSNHDREVHNETNTTELTRNSRPPGQQ